METKSKIITGLVVSLLLFFGMWFYVAKPKVQISPTPQPVVKDVEPTPVVKNGDHATTAHDACLGDDEVASFELADWKSRSTTTAIVSIQDKSNNSISGKVIIYDIRTSYHPMELRKCGVYFVREFNLDPVKMIFYRGYNTALWMHDYSNKIKKIIILAEKRGDEDDKHIPVYFSTDFRIDPKEKYLALTTGYLGSPDFALVIKDLETLKDAFTLPFADILAKNPSLEGDIAFNEWTQDGRYFWANIFGGAPIIGFIRIDTTSWTYELFPAPQDMLGGDALNVSTGDVTVHPGNEWSGVSQIDNEEKAARRAKGIGTDLYIYNLFTKKRTLVSHTDEPLAYFHPRWISSTTLEYFMPKPDGSMGERKEFVLRKQ